MAEQAQTTRTKDGPVRLVIVGAGIAGVSAAEAVRQTSDQAEIVLVSRERHLPYYRLNLTRYLAGEIEESDLPIHSAQWYSDNRI
jgi:nitrite reductase (NADH) large subunit